jgi:hypothetical protein
VLFDSRTNLEEGGGLCNELWLKFITDAVSDDGLLECMSVLEEARGGEGIYPRGGRNLEEEKGSWIYRGFIHRGGRSCQG